MIFASAIKQGEIIAIGKRHNDCIAILSKITNKQVNGEQGFVDEKMNWYDRRRAATHALKCGQITKLKYHKELLFSEDLW